MSVISKTEFRDEDVSPLDFGNLVVPISHNKERWVGILLGNVHSELLVRAVQRYVKANDEWSEKNDDHSLAQERRLAFIEVLRSISRGCETLASHVEDSYERKA